MLEPGTILQNRYAIHQVLGQGGMGTVYLAEQTVFAGRQVAIKRMEPVKDPVEAEKYAAQFLREAQLLGALRHPGLVEVKDYFEEDSTLYLVMEYVEGETLESLLKHRQEPFPLDQVTVWMREIFDVLEYLHGREPPVIFQDLKPSNLMVEPEGRIRLIDFGIARTMDPTTRTVTLVRGAGTPGYAAPEQHGGLGGVPADIYSAGATMYALLSNRVPAPSLHLLLGSAELAELSVLNPQVTIAVETAVGNMMALLAANRYQSAAAARAGLEEALQQPGEAGRLKTGRTNSLKKAAPAPPTAAPGFRIRHASQGVEAPNPLRSAVSESGPELQVRRTSGDLRRLNAPRPPAPRPCPGCGMLLEPGQICLRCLPPPESYPVFVEQPAPPVPETPAFVLPDSPDTGARRLGLFRRESVEARPCVRRPDNRDVPVQPVSYGAILVFNTSEWFEIGEELRFALVRESSANPPSIGITIQGLLATGTYWQYFAQVNQDAKGEMARYLKTLDQPAPPPTDRRAEPRVACKVRVTSPDLPQYQAISSDISRHGLALLTKGPLQIGQTLTLRIDFDDDRFAYVVCKSQVRWCYYGLEGEFRVGTRLQSISPEHAGILKAYMEFVESTKPRFVT